MATRGTWAFTDPEKVEELVEDYFSNGLKIMGFRDVFDPDLGEKVWKETQIGWGVPGVAGLAYHLGISRRTFLNYVNRASEESDEGERIPHEIALVLARAKARIEAQLEAALMDRETHKGAAFSLAHNFKWSEGKENADEQGARLVQRIVPPAQIGAVRAIPKWSEENAD